MLVQMAECKPGIEADYELSLIGPTFVIPVLQLGVPSS
jgi:hypothetical protein